MTLKIKKLNPDAKLPVRSTPGSAGMDLCALLEEPLTVAPGGRVTVPTGIAIRLPSPETVGLIFARSGLAVKHGLTLSNSVGVIDSDYTGELRVGLVNLSQEAYTIQPGERIAQLARHARLPAPGGGNRRPGRHRTGRGRLRLHRPAVKINLSHYRPQARQCLTA